MQLITSNQTIMNKQPTTIYNQNNLLLYDNLFKFTEPPKNYTLWFVGTA